MLRGQGVGVGAALRPAQAKRSERVSATERQRERELECARGAGRRAPYSTRNMLTRRARYSFREGTILVAISVFYE